MRYLLLFILIYGCSPVYFQPRNPGIDYRYAIENWQERIKIEGWTKGLVDDVVGTCIECSKYQHEDDDYWKTPQEFTRDFKGDCEDIGGFIYGTFKILKYPNLMRLRAIRMPTGDHVVFRIEVPEKKWRTYNTVPMPLDFVDLALSRVIVEWDDKNIYYED